MRIIVFSHVRLFSEALSGFIESDERVAQVEPCFVPEMLSQRIRELTPDIVLFDITNRRSFDEARAVFETCPGTRIFALALPDVAERVIACADAGFIGYFPREAPLTDLMSALYKAARNECEISPQITASLMQEIRRRRQSQSVDVDDKPLTKRESDVIALVACGHCNKDIARQLDLSVATVKNHMHNIFVKLHVGSRAEALAKFRDKPWLAQSA